MDNKGKSYSIVSLVCGIIGIIASIIPYVSMGAWTLLIVAIVFGAMGRKIPENNYRGMATTGLVLGIIGIALDILSIGCVMCVACAALSSITAL